MQHSSVAAAMWRNMRDKGVDESLLDTVERYNRIVTRLDISGRADRSGTCLELLSMYTTLRTSGYESDDAVDGLIETVEYMGWDRFDILMDRVR